MLAKAGRIGRTRALSVDFDSDSWSDDEFADSDSQYNSTQLFSQNTE